jgi:phage-related holin
MAAWIVLTEVISVTENLHKCGVNIPNPIIKLLHIAKEQIEEDNKNDTKNTTFDEK